jgi:hypothetical protein
LVVRVLGRPPAHLVEPVAVDEEERAHVARVLAWGATVRSTYRTPEAGTRTQYVLYVGPWGQAALRLRYVPNAGGWYACLYVPNGGPGACVSAQVLAQRALQRTAQVHAPALGQPREVRVARRLAQLGDRVWVWVRVKGEGEGEGEG